MLPLDDVKVLEITSALAGPLAGQLLGDLGAEVIKVEPPSGDGYRGNLHSAADIDPQGINPRFDCVNRNKRSLCLDLKTADGKAILEKLIGQWADVFVLTMRPGVPERLGLGYDRCRELNPAIIYSRLTGYGEQGPWSKRQGSDIWAQTMSGAVAAQGSPGGEPMVGNTAFADHGTPLALAFGIVTALHQRSRTGEGTVVRTSLLDTALYMQSSSNLVDYLNGGRLIKKGGRGWAGGFPYGAYTAADGEIVTMLVGDEQWDAFLAVLGLDHLRGLERYSTNAKRMEHRHELYPLLDEAFSRKTRAEWSRLFADTGMIRADPALHYDEVVEHPQVVASESIIPIPHSRLGAIMAVAAPLSVGDTRSDVRRGPPALGEQTAEVLAELGFGDDDIERLFAEAVVFDPEHPQDVAQTIAARQRYARDLGREEK